jgi:hypothetical protein
MKRDGDRRLPERIRGDARGRIVDDESCIIDCKVIDLSDDGARLELPHGSRIRSQFTLHIPSREIEHRAEVVWRNGYQVGVHFLFETQPGAEAPLMPPRPAPKPLSIDQLRKLVKR